jgi:hypothetical protein
MSSEKANLRHVNRNQWIISQAAVREKQFRTIKQKKILVKNIVSAENFSELLFFQTCTVKLRVFP